MILVSCLSTIARSKLVSEAILAAVILQHKNYGQSQGHHLAFGFAHKWLEGAVDSSITFEPDKVQGELGEFT